MEEFTTEEIRDLVGSYRISSYPKKIYKVSHIVPYEGDRLISLHATLSGAWKSALRESRSFWYRITVVGPGGDVRRMPCLRAVPHWLRSGLKLFDHAEFIAIDLVELEH